MTGMILHRDQKTGHYQKVVAVMNHFGQEVHRVPTEPSEDTRILRARLMLEEVLETILDGLGVEIRIVDDNIGVVRVPPEGIKNGRMTFHIVKPFNMVETVDGCADTRVVTTGTLVSCGVPDMELQMLVDDANIAKFGGGKDEHGKFQKPPGWKPADVEGLLQTLTLEAQQHPIKEMLIIDDPVQSDSAELPLHRRYVTLEEFKQAGKKSENSIDPAGGGRGA